jgi:hypothetical protein
VNYPDDAVPDPTITVTADSASSASSPPAPSSPPSAADVVAAKRARVLAARVKAQEDLENRKLDADCERLSLLERLERETGGKDGQQFGILDCTDIGEGFFAVKLAPSIIWKNYWDSKMTDVDRCDLITACLAHPEKTDYLAARNRRNGIDVELCNLVAKLNGLKSKDDAGK